MRCRRSDGLMHLDYPAESAVYTVLVDKTPMHHFFFFLLLSGETTSKISWPNGQDSLSILLND